MIIKEFLVIYLFCSGFPIIILWLIPKQFMIDQAVGGFFRDMLRCPCITFEQAVKETSKFEQEYIKSYYKDLAIFCLWYAVIIFLIFAFMFFAMGYHYDL